MLDETKPPEPNPPYAGPPPTRVIAPIAGRQTHDRLRMHCLMKRSIIVKKKLDWWTAHGGVEGAGKSSEAIWNCAMSDPTFIHDWRNRISYTADQFLEQYETIVDSRKLGRSLLLDEAGEAWLNQEWATQVQRTLTKVSIGYRFAGCDVHLAVPSLKLLGASGVRRLRDYAHIEMHNFERGFVTYYSAYSSPFSKYKGPYWNALFYHHFDPLPAWFYDKYEKYKVDCARERLMRYIGQVGGKTDEDHRSMKEIVNDVVEKASRRDDVKQGAFYNNRGNIESLRLLHEYHDELRTLPNARIAAILLTERLRKQRQKTRAEDGREVGA